ncbi:hypothetical protein pEaSNUABM28_00131 [Erwinia phage pEa_SNUABM_28]|uniref:Virion structural protein n=2 Tax=Alexandravirus TaxID=2733088 RepID=A0AAE8XQP7_9CAUD|nr:hypothetical protein MPK63_gp128 [Erwinia phage pEa_SNUABM_22]YP_010299890.1 hypothetical protein MPK64_gp129 [Erwinia phage pEa_SNUABM_16]QZE58688.1 hypothetical protein pEaSNUABM28_00131 [Erwinia phage pEa_SNUABM_28]QZE59032.1 hypothetical protein pEaSNUABM18_00129 [Erwinia phage pEa_SNUABM_18]UAW96273.1 hypothetical protein pEaSNUABM16_00129 [Erwinia phage pEa_SNUABM_16]UAW96616.1 hypothetical protein pEaSNUABM22_00129 [Erwinia phage pEa_SNUABM_22]
MADQATSGGVKDQGFFGLLLDGKAPPSMPNLINSVQVFENTFAVPCALIKFSDQTNVLRSTHAIVDGTKITLMMGPDQESASTFTFSVFAVREYGEGGAPMLNVLCALDAPAFLFDTRSFSIRGTSIDALKQVASFGGLTPDFGDIQTSDIMSWVSATCSPKKFAHEIEQHMWVSEEALPKMFITADKRMVVRDINKLFDEDPKAYWLFNHKPTGDTPLYNLHEFRPKSMSGIFNGMSNYGEKLLWADSKGKTNELSSVTVKGRDPLNINSDTRGDIAGARKAYARPTNDINIHDKYMQAYYNNKRQSMAYTETARALILGGCPEVDIFDIVDVSAGVINGHREVETDIKVSGKWLVIGRTRVFSGGMYSEAFLLSRNFTPVEGTSNIGGGSNIIQTPLSTVANVLRPFQINANIKQALDGSNPIDWLSQQHNLQLDVMLDQFQTESEAFKFPELAAKYGEGVDYLNALMQEFNMAKYLTGICSALNSLEKLSVNLAINYKGGILDGLASRLDSMENMLGGFTNDVNGLIANGDIPAEYLDGPQINQRCVSNKLDDMNRMMSDALPDKCLDALSISKLLGPSTNLSQLIRQQEENLRNFLCSLGDGTVDGSSTHGTPDGERLEMYMPRVNK